MQYNRKPDKESNYISNDTSLYRSEIKPVDSTNISRGKDRHFKEIKLQMQTEDRSVLNLTPYKSECVSISFRDASEGKTYEKPFTVARLSKKGQSLFNNANNSFSVILPNRNNIHYRTHSLDKENKLNISPIKRQTPHEQSELLCEQINIIPTDKCIVNNDNLKRKSSSWFNPVDPNKQEGYLNIGMSRIYQIPQRKNHNSVRSLSHILLKSKTNSNDAEKKVLRFTLTDTAVLNRSNNLSTSPSKRFIKIALAALSGKGPNCENRPITRKMRNEKGGVIDFNTKNAQLGNKVYNVKKFSQKIKNNQDNNQIKPNIKQRDIAARIIQIWWRNILTQYEWAEEKIKKIQSMFRGFSFRNYLVTYLNSKLLCENFIYFLNVPLVRKVRQGTFTVLKENFAESYKHRVYLQNLIKVQKFIRNRHEKRLRISQGGLVLSNAVTKSIYLYLIYTMKKIRQEKFEHIYTNNISPASQLLKNFSNRHLLFNLKHRVDKYSLIPQLIKKLVASKESFLYNTLKVFTSKWKKASAHMKRRENLMKIFLIIMKEKINKSLIRCYNEINNKANVNSIIRTNKDISKLALLIKNIVIRKNTNFFSQMRTYRHRNFYTNKLFPQMKTFIRPFKRKVFGVLKLNQIQVHSLRKVISRQRNKANPVSNLARMFLTLRIKAINYTTLLTTIARGFGLLDERRTTKKKTLDLFNKLSSVSRLKERLMTGLIKKKEKRLPSYFNMWKINTIRACSDQLREQLRNKVISKPIRNFLRNSKRIDLKNSFLHWKEMSLLQTAELTSRIYSGLTKMKTIIHNFLIRPSFLRIRNIKNFPKSFKKIIPVVQSHLIKNYKDFIDRLRNKNYCNTNLRLKGKIIEVLKDKYDKVRTIKTFFFRWRSFTAKFPKLLTNTLSSVLRVIKKIIFKQILKPAMKTANIGFKLKIPNKIKKVVSHSIRTDITNMTGIVRSKFSKWKQLLNNFKTGISLMGNLIKRNEIKSKFAAFNSIKGKNLKLKLLHIKLRKLANKRNLMKEKFKVWQNKLNENTIKQLCLNYLSLHPEKERNLLITRTVDELIDTMRRSYEAKKKSSKTISNFFKGILSIKSRLRIMRRQKNLHGLFNINVLRNSMLARIAFNKWKSKSKENNLFKSSKIIQDFIRGKSNTLLETKNKKDTLTNFHKKSKLLPLVSNLSKDIGYKLRLHFLFWSRFTKEDKFHSSARIIQRFFMYTHLKKNKFANQVNILKTFKGLHSLDTTFMNAIMRYPFKKIQQEANRRVMIKFIHYLRNKRLNTFNYGLKRLKKFVEVKTQVETSCVTKIQNIFRMRFNKNKLRNLILKIRKIRQLLIYATNKNLRCKDSYFKKWRRLSKISIWSYSSIILQNFIKKNLEKRKLTFKRKINMKLNSLFNDYLKLNVIIPYFSSLTNQYRMIRATKIIETYMRRDFYFKLKAFDMKSRFDSLSGHFKLLKKERLKGPFEAIHSHALKKRIHMQLYKIYRDFNSSQEMSLKDNYLYKWKSILIYYRQIYPIIKNNMINRINEADRRSKLFIGMLVIRLKVAQKMIDNLSKKVSLRKIKKKSHNKEKLEIFSECLNYLDKSLLIQKTKYFKNKIIHIYIYKVLIRCLIKPLERKFSFLNDLREFLHNLEDKAVHNSLYRGKINHGYNSIIKETKCNTYDDKTTKTEINLLKSGAAVHKKRMSPYIYITPLFIKVVSKILQSRLVSFMSELKVRGNGRLINLIFTRISKRHVQISEIFHLILSSGEYLQRKRMYLKFSRLVSRHALKNLQCKILSKISRVMKLMHLIKLTLLHRHIAKQNFIRAIILKLSLYSRMKQISKNKMSSFYKNMSLSYIMEADNALIGIPSNPNILQESDNSYLKYFK